MPWISAPFIKLPKKMRPNDPCWCGSGVKYKKCHRDRKEQKRDNIYELMKKATVGFRKKYCSHPHASPSECGKVIKSHTITKGSALKAISEQGHVLGIKEGVDELRRSGGRLLPTKVGINTASTFYGFCDKHDNATFARVECGEIIVNEENVFLLAYRAVAHELYLKDAQLQTMMFCKNEMDKGTDVELQLIYQSFMHKLIECTETGAKDIRSFKHKYDRMLIGKKYDDFSFVAFKFNGIIPVVTSGVYFPVYDFDQNMLFDSVCSYNDPPLIQIGILNDGYNSIAAMSWTRKDTRLNDFAMGFSDKVKKYGADFAAQMAITSCENTYFQPSWWASLDKSTQQFISNAALSGLSCEVEPHHVVMSQKRKFGLSNAILQEFQNVK